MDSVLRAAVMYLLIWMVFRVAGKRTLSEATIFDLLLVLLIAETTQQALVGEDHSFTNAFLLIITLVGLDILLSILKRHYPRIDRLVDGVPVLLVDNGQPLEEIMRKERIDEDDILEAARQTQGLERMDQVKYAVLERSGAISIIPR